MGLRSVPNRPHKIAALIADRTVGRALGLLAVLGIGLMLGACSKCDVPVWQHSSTGSTLDACHDGPAPQ